MVIHMGVSIGIGQIILVPQILCLQALQGQQTRTLAINGVNIPYDAFSNAYMNCAFWNGTAASTELRNKWVP